MALPQRIVEKDRYTEDEYFAFDATATGRWEYKGGEIRAMSGGTPNHSALAINLASAIQGALRLAAHQECRVFGSDLKVHTADGVNTYPDVSVVCGDLRTYRSRRDVIINPSLIAEVLSPSTEAYDRGDKWASYQTVPELQHYVLVSSERIRVEVYTRQDIGWRLESWDDPEDDVSLPALGVALKMAAIYAQVVFDLEETD